VVVVKATHSARMQATSKFANAAIVEHFTAQMVPWCPQASESEPGHQRGNSTSLSTPLGEHVLHDVLMSFNVMSLREDLEPNTPQSRIGSYGSVAGFSEKLSMKGPRQ